MRIRVTHLAAVFALLVCARMSLADSERIRVGDYLFVRAQVVGCGPKIRTVEVGEASDSGEVTFFSDLILKAENRTVEELTKEFVAVWEKKTGQQSKTIRIRREPDPKSATLKMLVLYQERKHRCGYVPLPRDFDSPNWSDYIHFAGTATHNKSFKNAAFGRRDTLKRAGKFKRYVF